MSSLELANIPPQKLGQLLAVSLDQSCNLDQISEPEKNLLSEIGVPLIQYQAERLALAGFAFDFAILKLLGSGALGSAVRAGYLEVWEDLPKRSTSGRAVYELFVARCIVYGKAAAEMFAEPDQLVNPLGVAFSDSIGSNHTEAGRLFMLGNIGVDLFFAHLEAARNLFEQARLVK